MLTAMLLTVSLCALLGALGLIFVTRRRARRFLQAAQPFTQGERKELAPLDLHLRGCSRCRAAMAAPMAHTVRAMCVRGRKLVRKMNTPPTVGGVR